MSAWRDEHPGAERLSALLDGQLAGEEFARVRAHLGVCAACRSDHGSLVETVRLLRDLSVIAPPRNFTIAPRRDRPVPLARLLPWTRVASGLAAAMLLVLVVLDMTTAPPPASTSGAASAELVVSTAVPSGGQPTPDSDGPRLSALATLRPLVPPTQTAVVEPTPVPVVPPSESQGMPRLWQLEALLLGLAVAFGVTSWVLSRQLRVRGA